MTPPGPPLGLPLVRRLVHAGGVHACALSMELHVPEARSLKAKRAVVRPLLEGARARFQVAASEVAYQDQWQRAEIAFAAIAGEASQVGEVLDKVERFVWSHPEVTVVSTERTWLETG